MRYGTWKPIPQWVGSTQKWTGRSGTKPRAIVIHRMEGSLEGSDAYLRREFADYSPYPRLRASTHFGVGLWGDVPTILTWVDTDLSAWGWWASPNDVPTPLARQVLGDLMYPIASWPYYASRIDLNRAVIAIEVEGFHDQPWDPRTTAKVKELIAALLRHHGPLTVMAHTDCSPKACPGMTTFQAAMPGYYGKQLGSLPKPPAPEDEMDWVKEMEVQDPKPMYLPKGVPLFPAPNTPAYGTSPGREVWLVGELRKYGLWAFLSSVNGLGLVRKSQAGRIG